MGYIYLIRHGEVAWNSEGAYIGSTDLPLNDTGRQQARLLSGHMNRHRISGILSSDLSRARETAEIIASFHKLPVIQDRRLREVDYGEWEGLTAGQISDRYSSIYALWQEGAAVAIPGGESFGGMLERAYTAFAEIAETYLEETVVIVAHKGVNRAILCKLLDVPIRDYRKIGQDNSGVNTIDMRADCSFVVHGINDRCHLNKTP